MEGNISTTEPGFKESLSFKVFKITLYSLILLFCLLGNSMVVFIVCRTKRMRMPSNLLILNLAICDLITPITSIPFDLALEENDYVWPFGRVLCKTLWPLATLSATSASLTLALISFDRYRVIMHPFKQRLSSKQVKYSIGFTHLLGLLFVLPYVYYLDLSGETHECKETWPAFSYRQAYTLFLFIAQYGIPLAFMSVMYSITLLNLHVSSSKFENPVRDQSNPRPSKISLQVDTVVNGSTPNGSRLDIVRDYRKASRETIGQKHDLVGRDQNIRATKMFVTVVIVFATCRLPNEIFWLWSDFGDGHQSKDSNIAGIICRMFTYTNSIFNPVIYWTFSKDFKRGFKGIFTSLCQRRRNGIWDDDLDHDEKRYHKISTLSDSISFVWRKLSRSRSSEAYSYHPDIRENQSSPINNGGHLRKDSQTKRACNGNMSTCFKENCLNKYGDGSERKKHSLKISQFDESHNHSSLLLPSQSKLAKLSEESLCETGEEVLNVRTRRYGTVQPPGKHVSEACQTIIKITRPLSEIDPLFSTSEDRDNALCSTLVEVEDLQATISEGVHSSEDSKDTSEDTKESTVNIDKEYMTQSPEQEVKDCEHEISSTVVEKESSQLDSEGVPSSDESKDAFEDQKECTTENIDNVTIMQSAEHEEEGCDTDDAITSSLTAELENSHGSTSKNVLSLIQSKDTFVDKKECTENIENLEACETAAAENNEKEQNIFLKQPTSNLNQKGIKETDC